MATEIKPGDVVGIGPASITWVLAEDPEHCDPTIDVGRYAACVEQNRIFPWHPVLPAIARLLAEHGDALAAAVNDAIDWIDLYSPRMIGDERTGLLRQLSAALGTDGGDNGNG